MAIIFQDNFNSYTVGSTSLPSWFGLNLGFIVDSFGLDGNSIKFAPGGGGIGKGPLQGMSARSDCSVYFSFYPPDDGGVSLKFLSLQNSDPLSIGGNAGIEIVQLGFEGDLTLSVYSGGKFIGNTMIPAVLNDWNHVQLDIELNSSIVGGVNVLSIVTCRITLNGLFALNAPPTDTTIPLSTLPDHSATFNTYQFFVSKFFRSWLDNVTVETVQLPNVYPNLAVGRKARITQAAVEAAEIPSTASGRISQMSIEAAEVPSDEHVRISQMVIELITIPQQGTGFLVSEA